MDLISVRMPAEFVDALDELALRGKYAGRSEAIRVAIRDFVRELRASHSEAHGSHKLEYKTAARA